ncbi:metalloendopeptidase / zinc ion binding protein [Striga asiatica]|uniref:Metalloendopeptidase / zinc ion binding protein n=2 Tax=Magnoliopsida TaxID=3398 RepID=A0A5A7QRE6_STRAF|nr:metalloendopeptidase / zinc ion binding protein [Striga asiatica]
MGWSRSEKCRRFDGNGVVFHSKRRRFMEFKIRCNRCTEVYSLRGYRLNFAVIVVKVLLFLLLLEAAFATAKDYRLQSSDAEQNKDIIEKHSCIHDQIIEQRKRPGRKVYTVSAQVYIEPNVQKPLQRKGRALLSAPELSRNELDSKAPIRIYLNYDAVGHSSDRDCRSVGDIVKLGEPNGASFSGGPSCDPHGSPPIYGDCWYNCTLDDVAGEDKKYRLRKALGQTAEWFKRALSVEPVKGNLRLSGYSACGQDGGVQLPRGYVEEGVADADLVLLVTTRPTTGNTLAWAVACERDQWGRAIAGHVNVAPRHLTAEAETLLSATLIHEVMHVLGFDPHAFAHFRDERKRRRTQVTEQLMDEKLGRVVTRVVLPRVIMHSRYHYGAFSENFTGLELEDGGGRGTSGSHWEKRLLMNEIMTGSVDTRSVVSRMTLALLEDSGWYRANYSSADHLEWGHHQGTEFVTSPCNQWKGAYHCNSTQFSGCTYNREAEGYCPIMSYSGDLPQWAQYFPQPNKGGQSSLADYCTYFVAYSDGSCTDISSARAPDRMLGEVRGSDSRCMASSLVRSGFVRGSATQGNGCYQHRCLNNSLEVAVDGIWKVCPEAGGPIQFPGFNGQLICPAYHELCNVKPLSGSGECLNSCSFNGDCINGKCHCFRGFEGKDCSKPAKMDTLASTALQCSLHGGVCDNGVCEFRCSDYAGYSCLNTSAVLPALSVCREFLPDSGRHCAPADPSVLQQLERVVVMPNYHRLFPAGPRKFLTYFLAGTARRDCDRAAKRLACWISIQKCDKDWDNRIRVCHSACQMYNSACGASLDCSDQTLFSNDDEAQGQCTGWGEFTSCAYYDHHLHDPVACVDVFLSDPFHTSFVPGGLGLTCNSGGEIDGGDEISQEIGAQSQKREEPIAGDWRGHHSPAPENGKQRKKSNLAAGNHGTRSNSCSQKLSRKAISQYFYMPIAKAAKEMNVGVTLLKKRCRELGIPRWPHRKLMSLQTLINNVQEMAKEDNGEINEEAIKILEQQMREMEEAPDMDLEVMTKRLRQACFKANYKKRKLVNAAASSKSAS